MQMIRPGTAKLNTITQVSSSSQTVKKVNQMVTIAKVQMNNMKRRTFRGSEMPIPKVLLDQGQQEGGVSYIQLLPFELIMMIATYCAAEESYAMISLNKDLRSNFIAAKTIIYRQQFCSKKQINSDMKI